MIKNKPRGFIDRPRKGVGVGEETRSRSRARLALAHADVFERNEKKNKTTSVYSLPSF